ncbi:MAG: alkaline phosphatase family protein [Elusimicrobiota bacterium]
MAKIKILFLALTAVTYRASIASSAAADPKQNVILISVDGMKPGTYLNASAHDLKIPFLLRMMREGAYSEGLSPVMPTVTYPSHTSMVTGDEPAIHGITTNGAWDPRGLTGGDWRWFSEDIKVPTIWGLAYQKGLKTALISWPVTVGAQADDLFPEFWRAGGPPQVLPDDLKILRALSSPGFMAATAAEFPSFYAKLTSEGGQDGRDEAFTDMAVHALETIHPKLLLLHLVEVDHAQHEYGLWTPQAAAAIENADSQIGRLIAATQKFGLADRTIFVIVSDHGFASVSKAVRPGIILRQNGLVSLDKNGRVSDWKAAIIASGGSAYIYLKDPNDAALKQKLLQLFGPLAGEPGSGIHRVVGQDVIKDLGGDPKAFLALEAADGYCLLGGYDGNFAATSPVLGAHGYFPDRPAMRPSLIIWGPDIHHGRIKGGRLVDIGPTIADWLNLPLKNTQGRVLRLPRF